MENKPIIKYVTDQDRNITGVILSKEDYLGMLEILIQQATIASLNLSIEHLNIMPKGAVDFLNLTVKASKNKWSAELKIKDESLADVFNIEKRTIQRKRNNLKEYMKSSKGKAVIDIKPDYAENGKHIGQKYFLNIFQSIENGIKNFIENDENYIQALLAFICEAEITKLNGIDAQNNKFKQIFKNIVRELDLLNDKPIIIETFAVLMRKEQARSER